jgi:hypothetical protein
MMPRMAPRKWKIPGKKYTPNTNQIPIIITGMAKKSARYPPRTGLSQYAIMPETIIRIPLKTTATMAMRIISARVL